MKIVIAAPVKGFQLKETLKAHLLWQGHDVIDVGCYATDRFIKYTSTGERVAYALQNGEAELAINICGSGTGASISINKFAGVLGCACESIKTAVLSRVVNGANCLCLGEDVVTPELARDMTDAFINAVFQDNPNADPKVREFWKEARDEMFARGVKATQRELETL
ncbi:MAG: RpiB/LacA/LacB family sugar-phosphate isomerase [Planctomycetaceae bacterium]|jgi:ribose 5-phosphate isomerase B|nr:RpiB/LacA/LacB family sugar-phosphate isomerase [Planctomycetaceae bacterium]